MTHGSRSPGLDLLRASAVLAVVAFHASILITGPDTTPAWIFPMGGIAVEVFYVLSGYLIGRILLELVDQATPGVWLRFMSRRWARTLPLYFAVLSFAAYLSGADISEIVRFATMSQNLISPVPHSALGAFLGTSWSLTVEEIFYLSFATTLLAAARFGGRRAVWPVIATFLLVPFILRSLAYGEPQSYYVAVLNLDGIAWGVALAQLERQGSGLFRHPVACLIAGLSLIAIAWVPYACGLLSTSTEWQPGTLSTAAAGCALVVAASLGMGSLGVAGPLVRAVSARSYSIYLVHWVVLSGAMAARGSMPVAEALAVYLFATAAVAYFTHRWIEIPGMAIRIPRMARQARVSAA